MLALLPIALVLGALAAVGALAWRWALAAALLIGGGVTLALVRRGADPPRAEPASAPIERSADPDDALAILDAIALPVLLLNHAQTVRHANAGARALLGEGLAGRALSALIRDPDVAAACAALAADNPQAQIEFVLPGEAQRRFLACLVWRQVRSGDGEIVLTLIETTAVQAAYRQRADFVANVSHELRTPLATLVGFIETLRGAAKDDREARERFLGIMAEQAGRMTRLVADLLSLAKIEEIEAVPPTASVDVALVVRGVADALALQAKAKDVTLDLDLGPAPCLVVGDGDQLAQVFQNLIDNAIKYGRSATAVRVTLSCADGRVRVAVADRGDGIPPDHIPRLTERFYRVDRGRSRVQGGTGLGLAIVKHILRRHRGSLEIDSAIGRGSTFTAVLPAARGSATVPA
jgi:two-component system phosphate regulon sensor histidine kinase PhoR